MEGISAGQEDGDGKSADVSRFPHLCRKMQGPAQPFWHLPSYLFRVIQMPEYHQMCNIILLPSLGSAVSVWWLADDQIFTRIRTTAVVFQIFLHFAS